MSVQAKPLISAKFASNSAVAEYTAPANTRTIVDKFTATNTDGSSQTLTVYIVPAGGSVQDDHMILKAKSVASGATDDLSALQNQVLGPGDSLLVLASVASKVVIRASGREVT